MIRISLCFGRVTLPVHHKHRSEKARDVLQAATITGAQRVLPIQAPNLSDARAFNFSISSSRFLGCALVSSEWRRRLTTSAISSMAARNWTSLAFDGLLKPLTFLTNWSEATLTSSFVAGGSKLKSVFMFLHIAYDLI